MLLNLSFLFLFSFSFFRLSLADGDAIQGDNVCTELMCVTAFVNSSTITCELLGLFLYLLSVVTNSHADQMTALNQLGWMAMYVLSSEDLISYLMAVFLKGFWNNDGKRKNGHYVAEQRRECDTVSKGCTRGSCRAKS